VKVREKWVRFPLESGTWSAKSPLFARETEKSKMGSFGNFYFSKEFEPQMDADGRRFGGFVEERAEAAEQWWDQTKEYFLRSELPGFGRI
jgi:hypothetical protein